jgi:hypothetical protein
MLINVIFGFDYIARLVALVAISFDRAGQKLSLHFGWCIARLVALVAISFDRAGQKLSLHFGWCHV